MIKEFVSGKSYVFIGPTTGISWNSDGNMNFIKDGKPHKCKEGSRDAASFYDSPLPDYMWMWHLSCFKEASLSWKETILGK